MYPEIKKANLVVGENVILRNATVLDSEFVLSLRQDEKKRKYISATSTLLEDQIKWFDKYKNSFDQAYFVICDKDSNNLGCIRVYNPNELTYCFGSWLMIDGLSPLIAIESVLLIFWYGKYLGFKNALIDVRKCNTSVWQFHEKIFSAERIQETELDYFYIFRENVIDSCLKKYNHLIADTMVVLD